MQFNGELLLKLAHCVKLPLLTLIGVDNFIVLLSGKYEIKKKEPNENQIQFHFFGQFFSPSSVIAPINGVERNDSGEVEGGRMDLRVGEENRNIYCELCRWYEVLQSSQTNDNRMIRIERNLKNDRNFDVCDECFHGYKPISY